jgi:AhpD family alkylhydroperoxidase
MERDVTVSFQLCRQQRRIVIMVKQNKQSPEEKNPRNANKAEVFQKERERLNQQVMKYAGLTTKRFYGLDSQAYQGGALPAKIKELMGLVSSLVLRCDDCIMHHLIRCREEGVSDSELEEALAIGLIVGGSITIPHIRRIWDNWENLKREHRPSGKGKKRQ